MKLPQSGGCQWGKIRYEITEAPQLVYTCHCKDCQRVTSSAFSMGIVVAERLSSQRHRGAIAPAHGWQRADQHAVSLPRVWVLGRQPSEGWRDPGPGWHARRYLLVAADPTHLDPEQAALGHVCGGRSDFRGAAARIAPKRVAVSTFVAPWLPPDGAGDHAPRGGELCPPLWTRRGGSSCR